MTNRLPLYCSLVALVASLLLGATSVAAFAARARRGSPATVADKPAGAPQARQLYPAGKIVFPTSGPGAVEAGVQCDANGNVYIVSAPSLQVVNRLLPTGLNLPLTKLSPVSKTSLQFPVASPDGYVRRYTRGFYVSPRGSVYGLMLDYRHAAGHKGGDWAENLVVRYNDDGTVDSIATLEPPSGDHLEASKFAVFLDGSVLITGTLVSGPKHMPTRAFTGIFDSQGSFVTELTLHGDVGPQSGSVAAKEAAPGAAQHASPWFMGIREWLMVGSLDGNVYMLRAGNPARLYAISPGGAASKPVLIKPPEPGMEPSQVSVAGGESLLVEYVVGPSAENPQARVRTELARVDPQTGEVQATYDVPPRAGIPACATSEDEFLFLSSDKSGQTELAKFVPR